MIGDLCIIDESPPQRELSGTRSHVLSIRCLDRLHNSWQCRAHILRQVPTIRARVADELVAFVQHLGEI